MKADVQLPKLPKPLGGISPQVQQQLRLQQHPQQAAEVQNEKEEGNSEKGARERRRDLAHFVARVRPTVGEVMQALHELREGPFCPNGAVVCDAVCHTVGFLQMLSGVMRPDG